MSNWYSSLTVLFTLLLMINKSWAHNIKDLQLLANVIEDSKTNQLHLREVLIDLNNAVDRLSDTHGTLQLINLAKYLSKSKTNQQQCYSDVLLLFQNLLNGGDWALQMIDAIGKPESGIFKGNFMWPGNYAQCLSVQAFYSNSSRFRGKYCSVFISGTQNANANANFGQALRLGLCVPDSCSAENIDHALKLAVNFTGYGNKLFLTPQCQLLPFQIPWTTEAIIMLSLLSIILVAIVFCTVVDILLLKSGYIKRKEYSSRISVIEDVQQRVISEASRSRAISFEDQLQQEADDVVPIDTVALTPPTEQPIGIFWRFCLALSVRINASKILNVSESDGTLGCLHGIRFISMTWVILGHVYVFLLQISSNVIQFAYEALNSFTFQAILNASVSVDTFFFMSGFLTAYLFFRETDKIGGVEKVNWFKFYFHRFWRLTPPYMLVLATYTTLYQYVGDGPFWPQNIGFGDSCHVDWWKNLLYINNLYNSTQVNCMTWSWYLANDMQFYILSPIVLVPLALRPYVGMVVSVVFVVVCMITRGIISRKFNFTIGLINNFAGDYFNIMYIRPWTRYAPFVIGILGGYLIHVHRRRIYLPKWLAVLLWILSISAALAVVYGPYDITRGLVVLNFDVTALYNSTFRVTWSLALLWLVIACVSGYGGWINTFLSWPAFIPLSRLTYLAYLVHPLVISGYAQWQQQTLHFDNITMAFLFLSLTTMSYALAFVASLIFESPFMSIEKIFRKS